MAYHEAKRFIEAFPEAKAWSVSVLTQDKSKALVQRPQCSREVLLRELNAWMKIAQSHFFLRPLLSNVWCSWTLMGAKWICKLYSVCNLGRWC